MPTLLIPPITTYEAFLSRPGGFALALKNATGTSVDIKTVKKVIKGTASEDSTETVLADLLKTFPAAVIGTDAFDAHINAIYLPMTNAWNVRLP